MRILFYIDLITSFEWLLTIDSRTFFLVIQIPFQIRRIGRHINWFLILIQNRQAIYKNIEVQQVNLAATSGDMGVLAQHVPTIEQLKPGVIEVLENASTTKKYFGKSHWQLESLQREELGAEIDMSVCEGG